MKRSGTADLPLHYGHIPLWLAERMGKLGLAIVEEIISHKGIGIYVCGGKKEIVPARTPLNWRVLAEYNGLDAVDIGTGSKLAQKGIIPLFRMVPTLQQNFVSVMKAWDGDSASMSDASSQPDVTLHFMPRYNHLQKNRTPFIYGQKLWPEILNLTIRTARPLKKHICSGHGRQIMDTCDDICIDPPPCGQLFLKTVPLSLKWPVPFSTCCSVFRGAAYAS
ncbi:hypothetical protein FQR65_LT18349 [Abscondita terminalis]|nr:hypothetical protein FQR65_LT18349 [Abscondita terminalis]